MVKPMPHSQNCTSFLCLLFCLFIDLVPHAPYRFDPLGLAGQFAHFFPQAGNVCHNGIVAVQIFFAPDCFEQFFGRNHMPLAGTEIPEDLEFQRCQRKRFAVEGACMAFMVDVQSAAVVHCRRSRFRCSRFDYSARNAAFAGGRSCHLCRITSKS